MNLIDNIFYVYLYLDPRKPGLYKYGEYIFYYEPFYVGKGCGNRIDKHLYEYYINNDSNKHKTNKIRKIIKETGKDPIILKFKENLFELEALNLEELLIKTIGRKDLKLGPLVNMTDGGDGGSNPSEETRKKISDAHRGEKNHNFGKPLSEETKQKLSNSHKGKQHSEETKTKISESHKGEKNHNFGKPLSEETKEKQRISMQKHTYRLISPKEIIYDNIINLRKFCKEHKLNQGKINHVVNGKLMSHKGWTGFIVGKEYLRKEIEEKHKEGKYKAIDPNDKFYDNIQSLKEFCEEHELNYGSVGNSILKDRKYKNLWLFCKFKIEK